VYLYLLFNIYNNSEKNRKGELKMRNIIMSFAEKFNGKEVKKMKNLLAIVIAITMVISTSGLSFAAFDTIGEPIRKTAVVTTSGTEGVVHALSVQVKNVGTNTGATDITWTVDTAADWVPANQYLEIGGFATYPNWGIQIYTDNAHADANPKYTGTGNPAGLVNASTFTSTLPMSYRVTVNSNIRDGRFAAIGPDNDELKMQEKYIATGLSAEDTVILRTLSDYVDDEDFYAPWYWMQDKKDLDPKTPGNQTQYSAYTTFVDSGSWKLTPTDLFSIPEKSAKYCVYLGAKFTGAAAQTTYKTNRLTVEMYHL
jgi:hypothetical protein